MAGIDTESGKPVAKKRKKPQLAYFLFSIFSLFRFTFFSFIAIFGYDNDVLKC